MHDFAVAGTVSGPYDVPYDPKPRSVGQQRRKTRPSPCCPWPFLYDSTLDSNGNFKVFQSDAPCGGAGWMDAAAARTRCHT
jgi:hypothetical protein